jgi:hypothetical protein
VTRLHKRYGLVRNLLSHILRYLDAMHMLMFQRKKGVSWIRRLKKCIFIGYKDGVKGYKLWNPETKKVVYSRDVVFREMKDVVKQEVLPSKEEPEKIEFDLKDDEVDSTKEHE